MQCELYVTAALNPQFRNDVERRGAQHLVVLIHQGLAGRDNDRVARMYADRVKVFHITYRDTVALGVAHHFVFDFFPARNALFNQNLCHAGKAQTVGADFAQLLLVVGNAAARTAQGICGAHNDGVADAV